MRSSRGGVCQTEGVVSRREQGPGDMYGFGEGVRDMERGHPDRFYGVLLRKSIGLQPSRDRASLWGEHELRPRLEDGLRRRGRRELQTLVPIRFSARRRAPAVPMARCYRAWMVGIVAIKV